VGKTKSLEAQRSLCYTQKWYDQDYVTLAGADSNDQEFLSNSDVVWVSYDLSRMSDMAAENTLKVVCALLTEHQVFAKTSGYKVVISNSNLGWLGACDHVKYNELWDTSQWRGNSKDRILRYHQYQYRHLEEINDAIPQPRIVMNSPKLNEVRLEDKEGYRELVSVLESQFSENRAMLWGKRLGQACAVLNNRDYTCWADWKYLLMHRINIEIEKSAAGRTRFTSPLVMDADALDILSHALKYGEVSKEFLMEKSMVTDTEYGMQKINDLVGWLLEENHATGKITCDEALYRDNILPQLTLENWCVHHGKEFYNYDEMTTAPATPIIQAREIGPPGDGKQARIKA
jgi:hypothetical protein